MLYYEDGITKVDMTNPNYMIPDEIGEDVIYAVKREFKAALMAYRNGHGALPFCVYYFLGGNNWDWESNDYAVKHLYRYYQMQTQDNENAYNEARKMAGKIFAHVLAEDPLIRYRKDGKRVFDDGHERSVYTII